MKICPNCGTHLKGDEVFCPNCGYDLSRPRQKANQQTSKSDDQLNLDAYFDHLERSMVSDQASQSGSNVSEHLSDHHKSFVNHDQNSSFNNVNDESSQRPQSSVTPRASNVHKSQHSTNSVRTVNYLNWWWRTVRHPAQHLTGHWYFSLISFGISYLLWILSFHSLMGRFNSLINSFFGGQISVDNAMFENADQSWWGLIIIGLLAWFSYWLLGFSFKKFRHELDFWQYSNQLAALTNLTLPLLLITLILVGVGLVSFAMLCFFAVMIVNVVGLIMSIVIPDRNKLYLAMLAVGLVPLIVVVVFTCIVQIIG